MQNFGCSDWACVEANFKEGGRYSSMWGWLDILRVGEDGDTVNVDSYAQMSGQQVHVSGSGQLITKDGHISVVNVTVGGNIVATFDEISDNAFAQFALTYSWQQNHVGLYRAEAFVTRYDVRAGNDCVHHDCVAQTLDGVSATSSSIAAVCAFTGFEPCAVVAGGVSTISGGVGVLWTGYNVYRGQATWTDLGVNVATAGIGYKYGLAGKGTIGVAASVDQLYYDTRIAPGCPNGIWIGPC